MPLHSQKMLPLQKTKKEIEQQKLNTQQQRKQADAKTDDLLKLQTKVGSQKSASSQNINVIQRNNEQKSLSEAKVTTITISGIGGGDIKPSSGKGQRVGSAKPIMPPTINRSQIQIAKNVQPPTKKPAQILESIGNQPKQQQLMQEYQNLYKQTMNTFTGKQQPEPEHHEIQCVREAIKNFKPQQTTSTCTGGNDPINESHAVVTETQSQQQQWNKGTYENCDIFENDNDQNEKHDTGCGGDAPPVEITVKQSNQTQAEQVQGTYMEQIQTSLILNQLVQDTYKQGLSTQQRRLALIKQIMSEDGDDGFDPEDVLKEIEVIEKQKHEIVKSATNTDEMEQQQ